MQQNKTVANMKCILWEYIAYCVDFENNYMSKCNYYFLTFKKLEHYENPILNTSDKKYFALNKI